MNRSIVSKLAAVGLAASLTAGSAAGVAATTTTTEIDPNAHVFERVDSIPMMTRPQHDGVLVDDFPAVWARHHRDAVDLLENMGVGVDFRGRRRCDTGHGSRRQARRKTYGGKLTDD